MVSGTDSSMIVFVYIWWLGGGIGSLSSEEGGGG